MKSSTPCARSAAFSSAIQCPVRGTRSPVTLAKSRRRAASSPAPTPLRLQSRRSPISRRRSKRTGPSRRRSLLSRSPRRPDQIEKIAVATAFHDLGIWTDGTFDYLGPSVRLARAYLTECGHPEKWVAEVERMILEHHELSASQA